MLQLKTRKRTTLLQTERNAVKRAKIESRQMRNRLKDIRLERDYLSVRELELENLELDLKTQNNFR